MSKHSQPRPVELGPRRSAAAILARVEHDDAWAGPLIDAAAARLEDPRDGALVRELVLGVLRHRSALDHGLATLADRPVARIDRRLLPALRIGLFTVARLPRTPHHAAVDGAMRALPRGVERGSRGFVNAVLREATRRDVESWWPPVPREGSARGAALYHSHPRWWTRALIERLGWEPALARLEANNRPAPVVLRPDPRRTTAEALLRRAAEAGLEASAGSFVPQAVRIAGGSPADLLAPGDAWTQDEASQLVAAWVGLQPGESVLDACAAPGGKTLSLATQVPDARIVALERQPARAEELKRRLARHGVSGVEVRVADATRESSGQPFDRVLIDAPCTGTGTLRRHPEIRWRLDRDDPGRLARAQDALLDALAPRVRPGGRLIYAVCSVEPEEGPRRLERFLERWPAFAPEAPSLSGPVERLSPRPGELETAVEPQLDGFYAARVRRRAER